MTVYDLITVYDEKYIVIITVKLNATEQNAKENIIKMLALWNTFELSEICNS